MSPTPTSHTKTDASWSTDISVHVAISYVTLQWKRVEAEGKKMRGDGEVKGPRNWCKIDENWPKIVSSQWCELSKTSHDWKKSGSSDFFRISRIPSLLKAKTTIAIWTPTSGCHPRPHFVKVSRAVYINPLKLATNPLACWIQGIPRCWLQPFFAGCSPLKTESYQCCFRKYGTNMLPTCTWLIFLLWYMCNSDGTGKRAPSRPGAASGLQDVHLRRICSEPYKTRFLWWLMWFMSMPPKAMF